MLKLSEGGYVKEVKEEIVGGGDLQQIIVLTDGKVIVLAYSMVCVYQNEEAYLTGDGSDDLLFTGYVEEK